MKFSHKRVKQQNSLKIRIPLMFPSGLNRGSCEKQIRGLTKKGLFIVMKDPATSRWGIQKIFLFNRRGKPRGIKPTLWD